MGRFPKRWFSCGKSWLVMIVHCIGARFSSWDHHKAINGIDIFAMHHPKACIGVKLIGIRAPMEFMAAFLGRWEVGSKGANATDFCQGLWGFICCSLFFYIFHTTSVQDALLFDLAKPTIQPLRLESLCMILPCLYEAGSYLTKSPVLLTMAPATKTPIVSPKNKLISDASGYMGMHRVHEMRMLHMKLSFTAVVPTARICAPPCGRWVGIWLLLSTSSSSTKISCWIAWQCLEYWTIMNHPIVPLSKHPTWMERRWDRFRATKIRRLIDHGPRGYRKRIWMDMNKNLWRSPKQRSISTNST